MSERIEVPEGRALRRRENSLAFHSGVYDDLARHGDAFILEPRDDIDPREALPYRDRLLVVTDEHRSALIWMRDQGIAPRDCTIATNNQQLRGVSGQQAVRLFFRPGAGPLNEEYKRLLIAGQITEWNGDATPREIIKRVTE